MLCLYKQKRVDQRDVQKYKKRSVHAGYIDTAQTYSNRSWRNAFPGGPSCVGAKFKLSSRCLMQMVCGYLLRMDCVSLHAVESAACKGYVSESIR